MNYSFFTVDCNSVEFRVVNRKFRHTMIVQMIHHVQGCRRKNRPTIHDPFQPSLHIYDQHIKVFFRERPVGAHALQQYLSNSVIDEPPVRSRGEPCGSARKYNGLPPGHYRRCFHRSLVHRIAHTLAEPFAAAGVRCN